LGTMSWKAGDRRTDWGRLWAGEMEISLRSPYGGCLLSWTWIRSGDQPVEIRARRPLILLEDRDDEPAVIREPDE